jgi:hypothetical protein
MKTSFLCLFLVGLTGCSSPIQRFVPVVVPPYHDTSGEESPGVFVLDTKTGQYCTGTPKLRSIYPLCYDLYTGKIK